MIPRPGRFQPRGEFSQPSLHLRLSPSTNKSADMTSFPSVINLSIAEANLTRYRENEWKGHSGGRSCSRGRHRKLRERRLRSKNLLQERCILTSQIFFLS